MQRSTIDFTTLQDRLRGSRRRDVAAACRIYRQAGDVPQPPPDSCEVPDVLYSALVAAVASFIATPAALRRGDPAADHQSSREIIVSVPAGGGVDAGAFSRPSCSSAWASRS
jgi:hypothetical protein